MLQVKVSLKITFTNRAFINYTDQDLIPSQPRKPLVSQSLRRQLFICAFLRPSSQFSDKQCRQRTCRPCPQVTLQALHLFQSSHETESIKKNIKPIFTCLSEVKSYHYLYLYRSFSSLVQFFSRRHRAVSLSISFPSLRRSSDVS